MSIIQLSNDEEEIYIRVKDYLNNKPFFMLEEIIDFLTQRMSSNANFTKHKITNIIKSLIKKKMIFPGTKLTRDDILNVQKRVEIYDYITAMPGTNINEIMKYIEVGANQALWHLKWLKKFEFIRSIKLMNQKVYFKKEFDPKYDKVFFFLRNSKVKKIIKAIKQNSNSMKPVEISEKAEIHYNTVQKYLGVLLEHNLLLEIEEEKKKKYLLNPDMLNLIQNVIENLK